MIVTYRKAKAPKICHSLSERLAILEPKNPPIYIFELFMQLVD